ncbi:MAG: pilus assembly protein TadG-related protein [Chloroflexota bacterium]
MKTKHREVAQRLEKSKGQIIVMFALMLTALIGMAALVTDMPLFLREHARMQAIADSAALAAAMELDQMMLSADMGNHFYLCTTGVFCSVPLGPGSTYCAQYPGVSCSLIHFDPIFNRNVGVIACKTVPTFFSRIFGRANITVCADAYAAMTDQY